MTPASVVTGVTVDTLEAFAAAFNRHDAEAIVSFMTPDCVFESSAGPDACGARHEGAAAVRAAFEAVWAAYPDARWSDARHLVCGDRGVSQWTFSGTGADGARVEVHGCDLFTFRDGRIALKDSYRKQRPPLPRRAP
jgi:ketosteroid isomerase-like protein